MHSDQPLPNWLSTANAVLLPKTKDTYIAKNYRPITCLNAMYKLYTSYINEYLIDHVSKNTINTQEQAAGMKGVWGTVEQLTNKSIMRNSCQCIET